MPKLKRLFKRNNPKMRTLDFKLEKNKDNFELIYEGFVCTPIELDRKDHRMHHKILDKLDAISIFKDKDKDARTINQDCSLKLEEVEFTFMIKCLEGVKFIALVSKRVDSMWSYLEDIKEDVVLKVE